MDNFIASIVPASMNSQNNHSFVTLTPLTVNHLEDFLEWATDSEVTKYLLWDFYTCSLQAKNFLETFIEKHPWFKAICVADKVIGSITLDQGVGHKSCKAELGYVIAKKYWGRGYGTAAVKEAIRTGFKELNIERIEAFVDPDNIASQRILQKCGFTYEGYLKNCIIHKGAIRSRLIFGITRD